MHNQLVRRAVVLFISSFLAITARLDDEGQVAATVLHTVFGKYGGPVVYAQ